MVVEIEGPVLLHDLSNDDIGNYCTEAARKTDDEEAVAPASPTATEAIKY